MSPTTTTTNPIDGALRAIPHVSSTLLVVLMIVATAVAAIVYQLVHRGRTETERQPRWEWLPNGQLRGPRWRRRRIRRALRPLPEIVAWTGDLATWEQAAVGAQARAARRARRAWRDAADALGWPSTLVAYAVGPEGREITVSAGEQIPDAALIAHRLDWLRVTAHASQVDIQVVDQRPSQRSIVIRDVRAEPRTTPVQARGYERNAFGVLVRRSVDVIVGWSFWSLYEPEIAWMVSVDPGDERTITNDDPSPILSSTARTQVRGGAVRGAVPTSAPDNARVRLSGQQLATIRHLAVGPLTSSELAARLGVAEWSARRSSLRLVDRGLLEQRGTPARWSLTAEGQALAPEPLPAPTGAPLTPEVTP